MDCYPEYHNHYHHYNSIHNPYFASNNNPSLNRFGSTQLNNEAPQSPLYEGFSRHNLHNHHYLPPSNHPFNGQGSSFPPFESNNENSQFYYSNMHQQPPSSYYGHHHPHQNSYESYSYPRNIPSNYRYHYGYHQSQHHYPPQLPNHSPHHFYPLHHQQQPQHQPYNNSNSTDHHYNHYQTPPSSSSTTPQQHTSQLNHHHQQGDFNPSTNNNSLRSNDFSFSSTSQQQEGQNSEKLLDKDVNVKHVDTSTINNPNVAKQNSESDDKINNNNNNSNNTRNDQQVSVNPSFEESSNEKQDGNSNSPKEIPKDEKAINKSDDNNTEREEEEVAKKHKNESFNENENCKENQQHVQQKNEEATTATDYSPESSNSNKVNKIPIESEKQQQNVTANSAISKLSEHHNMPNMNDRSPTPIAYNHHHHHHHHTPHSFPHKQRYPMSWYSHEYYNNNWMMNPDDRRNFPDSQTFFSSMRSKNKNLNPDKHKMQNDNSPSSTKRTKRKSKIEDSTQKVDPNKNNNNNTMKNVTPLPGFLQTFGQTEIGKFSEAFYTSDSPLHYYNNNIESDIDSPQLDWDSLDGPVGCPMPMQLASSFYMYGSENEFDSPISSFSEIMCKDF